MISRYMQRRRGLPDGALFLLAFVETVALLVAWAASVAAVLLFVAAPILFGFWGLAAWAFAYCAMMAGAALTNRSPPAIQHDCERGGEQHD